VRRVLTWAASIAAGAALVAWMWYLHGPKAATPLLAGLTVIAACVAWELHDSDWPAENTRTQQRQQRQRMAERNRRLDRAWTGHGPLFEYDVAHHQDREDQS